MSQSAEVAADFKDALQDLKQNSRPEISNLTLIAKENTEYAQAISRELENHIRTTRPEWKLPALYVLDSIVKNVGTPYTVYLGRDLYRTFMNAYTLMDPGTRKAMEGLLKTWKQPVPESMDTRPVFPPEVTQDIENALIKFRTIANQGMPQKLPTQHNIPGRPMPNVPWRSTPTPPQNAGRHAAANDPRVRQPVPQAVPYGQYLPSSTPPVQSQPRAPFYPPQPKPIDVEGLKSSLSAVISSTQKEWAHTPGDQALPNKLNALFGLQQILNTQTLPPDQLQQVAKQIQNMSPPAPPAPFPPSVPVLPVSAPFPPSSVPPPFPNSSTPVDLAQLFAHARPPVPPVPTPTPPSIPPSLAEMLQRFSSGGSSSAPPVSVSPFYPPPFSAAPPPVPAPAPLTPVAAPPINPTADLARILGQFSKPAAAPVVMPPQPAPLAHLPSQGPSTPAPAIDTQWLSNLLKTVPPVATQPTPISSQPMTRQVSANANNPNYVELTTASMKQPRSHLISKLYDAYPNICATCGRRFESTQEGRERKARHMDWHFKVKDPDVAKRGIHRSWYISEKEWIEYREVDEASPEQVAKAASGIATAPKKAAKDKYIHVPTDTALVNAPCPICQEKFEPQWHVEANDFVWMDAVKINGKIYHATCWEEYSRGSSLAAPSTPDSVLGKRKAEENPNSGKKVRAY